MMEPLINTHTWRFCGAMGSLIGLTCFGATRIPIPSVRTAMMGLGFYGVSSGTLVGVRFQLSELSSKKVTWLVNGALLATNLSLIIGVQLPDEKSDADYIWGFVKFLGANVLSVAVGFSDTLYEKYWASRPQTGQMPAEEPLLGDAVDPAAQIELAIVPNA